MNEKELAKIIQDSITAALSKKDEEISELKDSMKSFINGQKELQDAIRMNNLDSVICACCSPTLHEETFRSAAEKAGFELPFSCAGGMCATCRCKLVEGEVQMDVNYALEPWELEAGFVLACQSRPKSTQLRLDFDAT